MCYTVPIIDEEGVHMDFKAITKEAREAMDILLKAADPKPGSLMVLGCSTSETVGSRIGSNSSGDAAQAILKGILPAVKEAGLILAVQGCEHINRSLCLERADGSKLGLSEVWVRPHAHAGGACITAYYEQCADPVMVEDLQSKATLGMDIGDTLIGMHMRPVVVPVHSPLRRIGEANLVLAFSRPRYMGGPRAQYVQQTR